jgi:uncharacterized C2H2 Zn-finger protein
MAARKPKFTRHVCPRCGATFYTQAALTKHRRRPALCMAYRQGESYVTATRKET